jgi:hypothetical protein
VRRPAQRRGSFITYEVNMIIFCLGCKEKGLKPTRTRQPFRVSDQVTRESCEVCRTYGAVQVTHTKVTIGEVLIRPRGGTGRRKGLKIPSS